MNQRIQLSNGRQLGYAEYGSLDGFPVLFFHGLPGSRFEAKKLHDAAVNTQVRLIGLDRPGMGISSPKAKRTMLSWADDVAEFTTALNIEKFSVMGHSGGAPYTVVCAFAMPNKVHKGVIVSGIVPLNYPGAVKSLSSQQKVINTMMRCCPILLNWMMHFSKKSLDSPNYLKRMLKILPQVDQKVFENLSYNEDIMLSLREAFRQSVAEVVTDFKSLSQPLNFNLEDVQSPFTIWQGGKDKQAPLKHAEIYAEYMLNADLKFLPEEGHLSLLYNCGEEILQSAL